LESRNEAIGTVRDWWEAWFSGDIEAMTTLTCERYVEFGEDGEIMVAGNTALAEQARKRSASLKISEWAMVKPKVRRLEDAAVCKYHFRVVGTLNHTPIRMEGLVTDILVKVGGAWKLVAHHGIFPTALGPDGLGSKRP
jgi:ketosteroid isomerase-like protein